MKHILFAILLGYAQTAVVSDSIVVTAAAAPETIETTPAAVTIVTKEEIEAREARDVADVLREVPGLTVSRTGSQGKVAHIFIRGGSTKQALVLWNGVEVNNSYFSAYNLGQLASAGVERVEVVRGPYSALYGADAVSGVINVLTTPSRSGLTVDVESGENGLRNGVLSAGYAGRTLNAHAAIESRNDDGFESNDDFASATFLGGFEATLSRLSLGLIARHSSYDLGIPRNVNADFTAFVPTPRRREEGRETQIVLPIRFDTESLKYELRLAESRRQDDFADPDGAFGPDFAHTDARVRTLRASVQTRPTFAGVVTIGAELEDSVAEHQDAFGLDVDERDRDSRSLFVEDRISRGNLQVAIGARWDDFDAFGSEISPRLAVAWVRGNTKWRAAYGESFRAPAIGELYVPYFGNPDLNAERGRNFEVGFDTPYLSVTAFRGHFDDLIAFEGSRWENIDSAVSQGIEIGATRSFGPWTTAISYTFLDTEDEASGEPLLRRPEHAGSIALGYHAGPLSTQLVVIHAGARPDVTDLLPFGRVTNRAYTTADVTVRYDVGSLAPYLKLENATDEAYEEVFGYPSARRRFIAGIRYSLPRR
jgi:vitamin B12 transporter